MGNCKEYKFKAGVFGHVGVTAFGVLSDGLKLVIDSQKSLKLRY